MRQISAELNIEKKQCDPKSGRYNAFLWHHKHHTNMKRDKRLTSNFRPSDYGKEKDWV